MLAEKDVKFTQEIGWIWHQHTCVQRQKNTALALVGRSCVLVNKGASGGAVAMKWCNHQEPEEAQLQNSLVKRCFQVWLFLDKYWDQWGAT